MISLKTLEQGNTGSDQFLLLYPVTEGKLNSMVAYKFSAFFLPCIRMFHRRALGL